MGQRVLLKEAAQRVHLSEWELAQGARSGKYPAMRVGSSKGRWCFDITLLEARIQELMLSNIKQEDIQEQYGKIRAIVR